MGRLDEWRKVLHEEVRRWSAKSYDQLLSELSEQVYEVELDSKKYQVEVEILANTDHYVQVIVSVDDGSLPSSIVPLTYSFIQTNPASDKSQYR